MKLVRGITPGGGQAAFGHGYEAQAQEEWYTPRAIFDALGLFFDVDVASPLDGPIPWIPALRHLTRHEDGLVQPWTGLVWMNPPYGVAVGQWMARLRAHGNGVALVGARTESRWFQEAAYACSALVFPAGRIRFVGRDGTEGGCRRPRLASAFFGFGFQAATALHRCNLGWVAK